MNQMHLQTFYVLWDAGMLCGVSVRVGVSVEFVAMNRAMLNRQSVKESK